MSNMIAEICRLCLKPIYDGNFDAIDDISRKMLNVLLLKLNLDISKKPVMCYECATVLQNCFDFKSLCVSLETRTLPSIKSEEKNNLILEDVYLKQETMELSDTSADQRICYFCVKQNQLGLLTTLNESKGSVFMVNTIQKHIPEMNIRISQEILACEICIDSIKNLCNFITCCLDVEEKIKSYKTTEGVNDKSYIELYKIQQFMLPIINYEINCSDVNECKIKDDIDQDVTVKTEDVIGVSETDFNVDEDLKVDSNRTTCERSLETMLLPCSYKEEYEERVSASPAAKEFICEMCSFKDKDEKCFIEHMYLHSKEMNECKLCPFKGTRHNLRKHMLNHNSFLEVKMYKCDTCTFESKYKNVVKKHTLVHRDSSEIAMYKCDICPYEAKRRDSLKVHMLIHRNPSEITIYKCNICGQGVKYKKSLIKHMLLHKDISEITVYKCELCAYKSKYKGDLKKHVNAVHMGLQLIYE